MQIPSLLSFSNTDKTNHRPSANRAVAALLMAVCAFSAAASAPSPLSLAPAPLIAVVPAVVNDTGARKTDAVDFAIVIPAVLRLLENDHPTELSTLAEPATPISALQRVVLVSTLRSGFCMDLRLNPRHAGQVQVTDWQVQLAALSGAAVASGARVEAFEGGWRVCTRRAGRFELALQHAFSMHPRAVSASGNVPIEAMSQTTALGWPVALSLSTP